MCVYICSWLIGWLCILINRSKDEEKRNKMEIKGHLNMIYFANSTHFITLIILVVAAVAAAIAVVGMSHLFFSLFFSFFFFKFKPFVLFYWFYYSLYFQYFIFCVPLKLWQAKGSPHSTHRTQIHSDEHALCEKHE